MNCEKTYGKIVRGTKSYFEKSGVKKAVLGVSGGIDSALAAYVLRDALGSKNVFALLMPEVAIKRTKDTEDAIRLCNELEIEFEIVPIDIILSTFHSLPWKQSRLAKENLRARVRMVLLYSFSNSRNSLVVGTSNKSERELGYFTKYGDGGSDILPLGGLLKTEVLELAKWRGVNERIIKKKPSAGLRKGQCDEKDLEATYGQIDKFLSALGKKKKPQGKKAKSLMKRIEENRHKTKMPFLVRV